MRADPLVAAVTPGRLFQLAKYVIYAILTVNVVHFVVEAAGGVAYTFGEGLGLGDLIVAYADPIDSAAWLVLLLILELETYVLEDDAIGRRLWLLLQAITALCTVAIVYAFYGYVANLFLPNGFAAYAGPPPCTLAGEGASVLRTLDEYVPLTAETCLQLKRGVLHNAELDMFATPDAFHELSQLVWLDIVNAGTWLVVVVILQIEVYLQSTRLAASRLFRAYKALKLPLYGLLLYCVVRWWMLGDGWNAWDALVWLVAFFFIEVNVMSWQEEVARERGEGQAATPEPDGAATRA